MVIPSFFKRFQQAQTPDAHSPAITIRTRRSNKIVENHGQFVLALVLFTAVLFAGCDPLSVLFPSDTSAVKSSSLAPIVSAPQPARTSQICMNGTTNFSQQSVRDSLNHIATWLGQAIAPNQSGTTIYFTVADGQHTLAAQNTTLFTIPSFGPDHAAPDITPTPTLDPTQPYANADKINAVATANAGNYQAWQDILQKQHQALADTQRKLNTWMSKVHAMSAKAVNGTADLLNCVFLANRVYGNSPQSQHILILATNLPEYVPANFDNVDPNDLVLPGDTQVYVLWKSCDQMTASVCDEATEQWTGLFKQLKVSTGNIHILSPGQSDLQENPFLVHV